MSEGGNYFAFQVKNNNILNTFQSRPSLPVCQAPPPGSVIGRLDGKAVDVHGELPEVAADPGSVGHT